MSFSIGHYSFAAHTLAHEAAFAAEVQHPGQTAAARVTPHDVTRADEGQQLQLALQEAANITARAAANASNIRAKHWEQAADAMVQNFK